MSDKTAGKGGGGGNQSKGGSQKSAAAPRNPRRRTKILTRHAKCVKFSAIV